MSITILPFRSTLTHSQLPSLPPSDILTEGVSWRVPDRSVPIRSRHGRLRIGISQSSRWLDLLRKVEPCTIEGPSTRGLLRYGQRCHSIDHAFRCRPQLHACVCRPGRLQHPERPDQDHASEPGEISCYSVHGSPPRRDQLAERHRHCGDRRAPKTGTEYLSPSHFTPNLPLRNLLYSSGPSTPSTSTPPSSGRA